jgi:hypothetical protein
MHTRPGHEPKQRSMIMTGQLESVGEESGGAAACIQDRQSLLEGLPDAWVRVRAVIAQSKRHFMGSLKELDKASAEPRNCRVVHA